MTNRVVSVSTVLCWHRNSARKNSYINSLHSVSELLHASVKMIECRPQFLVCQTFLRGRGDPGTDTTKDWTTFAMFISYLWGFLYLCFKEMFEQLNAATICRSWSYQGLAKKNQKKKKNPSVLVSGNESNKQTGQRAWNYLVNCSWSHWEWNEYT